jgi:CRISPR-associated protein Cmr1
MHKITFTCETITPMFLAGADGSTPELRAPSIKGALRFWWRALNGHLSLGELKEREGEIFGNTDRRSKVIMRIENFSAGRHNLTNAAPTPHNPRYQKDAFRVGTTFKVHLSMMNEVKKEGTVIFSFDDLQNLFLLMATLGGIGGRVRRGFGAFSVTDIQTNNGTKSKNQPKTIQSIIKLLSEDSFKAVGDKIVTQKQRLNKYPYIKEIKIGSPNSDILKKIGQTTHDVKGINKHAYETALGHAARGRFASPIFVSVIKTKMGLRPVITTLNTIPNTDKSVDYGLQHTFKDKIL